jgi:hypothetical protein
MTKNTDALAAFEAAREAGFDMLRSAGANAAAAGENRAAAKVQGATALDSTIAGLSQAGILTYTFAFDVCDRGGNVVEHVKATLCDYAAGFHNADGSAARKTEGAFRAAMLPLFFGVAGDQSAAAKSVWQTFGKAFTVARAIVAEDMTAALVDNKLVLQGGTGERAEAMRKATSTSALVKVAEGKTGTNGSQSTSTEGEAREATPAEITRTAVALVKLIAKGEADACNATLSNLREIARLVANNPDAFAED